MPIDHKGQARALPQTALREITDRRLFDETISRGRTTRAELSDVTGYSRPTVSEAVRRLVDAGLLDAAGPKETGRRGRIGTFYELGARAGWVLGLEVDQAGVRWRATDLAGRTLAENRRAPTAPGDVAGLSESLRAAVREAIAVPPTLPSTDSFNGGGVAAAPASSKADGIADVPASSKADGAAGPASSSADGALGPASSSADGAAFPPAGFGSSGLRGGPLRAVAVSIANPVDPATHDTVPLAGSPFPEGLLNPAAMIADLVAAPVLVDNDVNLAALAEHRAASATNFAYVYVGAGLGVGLYIGDQLIRGAHGLAGEIGYLPGVRSPTLAGDLAEGGLGRTDAPSNDVAAVLALLDDPTADPEALRPLVDAVGRAVISVAAVVDPELILLGGPVGTHAALLPRVRSRTAASLPGQPRIDIGALGAHAPLQGALHLATDHARKAATASPASE